MDNQTNGTHNIPHLPASDHDLLIVMHTLLTRVIEDVERIREETSNRVTLIENTKVDETVFNTQIKDISTVLSDHELRIRRVERIGFVAIGALFIVEILFHFITKI